MTLWLPTLFFLPLEALAPRWVWEATFHARRWFVRVELRRPSA